MKHSFRKFAIALPLLILTGCPSSTPTNMVSDASQEELDNYDRLIAEANSDVTAADEAGDLDE